MINRYRKGRKKEEKNDKANANPRGRENMMSEEAEAHGGKG